MLQTKETHISQHSEAQEDLDQFFTRPEVAAHCWSALQEVLRALHPAAGALNFIEPSAGRGAFYHLMPGGRRIGMDLEPMRNGIRRQDFLAWSGQEGWESESTVVAGNPPFGPRGKLAVEFVNHAASMAATVAFIVPVIFRKHFIHKQLDARLRWVHALPLPKDAFHTVSKDRYAVNTEFQVWTSLPSAHADMRLFSPPPLKHRDFQMWQYNNTADALKMFENEFDFAVPCQGWQDYTRRETDAGACEKTKQWLLFKADRDEVRRRLRNMDFASLAERNVTVIPGFRKGDVVRAYSARYG